MKAIVQGEYHISGSDEKSLQSHLEEDIDALFREGRDDSYDPDGWSLGYLLFITGALIISWFEAAFYQGPDSRDETSTPVFDEIDTPLPDLYARFPRVWTIPISLLSGVLLFTGIYFQEMLILLLSSPPPLSLTYIFVLKLLLVIAGVFAHFGILIILEGYRMGSRDEDMAEAITEKSEEHGFEKVVISCGEKHLNRLPDLLEKEGWDVEIHSTNHTLASKLCDR